MKKIVKTSQKGATGESAPRKAIEDFFSKNHRMPSYRELAKIMGFASTNAAYRLVEKLKKAGELATDTSGRLIPTSLPTVFGNAQSSGFEIPFVGLVEAGFPSPAEEELRDTMSIDDYLIQNKEATFLMRAKGESMIDAGIVDGDMLVVERCNDAPVGSIVIALIDGSRTMKYLKKRQGQFYLEPANVKFPPMHPENSLEIEAKVVAVIRKY